jgi:hypothetical protein
MLNKLFILSLGLWLSTAAHAEGFPWAPHYNYLIFLANTAQGYENSVSSGAYNLINSNYSIADHYRADADYSSASAYSLGQAVDKLRARLPLATSIGDLDKGFVYATTVWGLALQPASGYIKRNGHWILVNLGFKSWVFAAQQGYINAFWADYYANAWHIWNGDIP